MVFQVAETEKTILFVGRERVGGSWRTMPLKEGVGLWEEYWVRNSVQYVCLLFPDIYQVRAPREGLTHYLKLFL